LHPDRQGTVWRATDASKTIVWTGNYDPNGAVSPTASVTMNLRFPGHHADATGVNRNGQRDYNPNSASGAPRYLEDDPFGLAGGQNGYVYADNNTAKWTDRRGLAIDPISVTVGAVFGGVAGYTIASPKGRVAGIEGAAIGAVAG